MSCSAEQAGDPRLSRFGVACDQDVPAADRERELAAVLGISEAQAAAGPGGKGEAAAFSEGPDVGGDSGRTLAGKNDVGG